MPSETTNTTAEKNVTAPAEVSVDTLDTTISIAEANVPASNTTKAEVSVDAPEEASAGSTIEIDWTGPALRGDYVSVAEPSSRGSRQHMRYQYVKTGQIVTIRMPENPGPYEIRYISGNSDIIRSSKPIKVTGPNVDIHEIGEVEAGSNFNITFTGGGYSGDYIAIFNSGEGNTRYSSHKYASRGNRPNFKAPENPGVYTMKYISGQKKLEWATREFTVKPKE